MSNEEPAGAQLRVQHTGQAFPIEKAELGIGRQEDNAIILADPRVSAYHAVIYWRAETGAFFIEDLESREGTYVNGVRLEAPRMLRDGDSIRIGNTVMTLTLPPAPGSTLAGTLPAVGQSGPGASSRRPVLAGIAIAILAGLAILCVGLLVVLLLIGGRGTPNVIIQSPAEGARIALGNELILRATASGATDITLLELRVDGSLVATASEAEGMSSLTVSKSWLFGTPGVHVISASASTAREKSSSPVSVKVTVYGALATITPTPEPPTDTPTPTVTPSPTPEDTATPTPTTVPPPQVEYFQASPASIRAGDCATLQWGKVNNAAEASIEPGLGGVGTPGEDTVCPLETTSYTLIARGPGGTTQVSTKVTVVGGLPDLTIDSIAFVPNPPEAEGETEVRVTVRNVGIGAAGAFDWEWQAGTEPAIDGRVYGLGAGESTVITLLWRPGQPQERLVVQARVDSNDEVVEKNEDNNQYTSVIQVIEVEMEPVTLTLLSEGILDGYLLNDGTGSSSRDILIGNGEVISTTGELVARGFMSFDLSDIPAGATIESAELRFYQKEIEGSPYQKLGNLVLEHVHYGTRFDESAYDTSALSTAVLQLESSPDAWYILSDHTIADWIQDSLAAGLSRQQFRLQFSQETDGDGQEDWIAIEDGGSILGSPQAPRMILIYTP
jgi:hypothetical protein